MIKKVAHSLSHKSNVQRFAVLRQRRSNIKGVTLLESMFVLAVTAVIIVMGIRLYYSFSHETEVDQIKANANQIFQAMSFYYQANCRGSVKNPGTLNPARSPAANVVVDLDKDLKDYLHYPLFKNSLITGKYVLQFNRQLPDQTRTIPKGDGSTYNLGAIVVWTEQVAVQVADVANIQAYKNMLAADCISSYSDKYVTPCSQGSNSKGDGDYLVWERLPSYTSYENKPSTWLSMGVLKQFTQLYTTYPINYLTDQTVTTQNYLCGG